MKRTKKIHITNYGFTFVELLIAMIIAAVVMSGIYMTFENQHKSFLVQDAVTTMQQNVRAGMYYQVSEIRMAGYNPGGVFPAPTITAANNNSITFQRDDGTGTNTIVSLGYSYDAANRTLDDAGGQPVAEEIEALGFAYAYDADNDGRMDTYTDATGEDRIIWALDTDGDGNWDNLDTNNDGVIDDNDSPSPGAAVTENIVGLNTGDDVDLEQIRAVRVSLLARTGRGDKEFFNNSTYIVGNQKITPGNDGNVNNDNCRMRLLTTIVNCRNMGL